MRLPSSPRGGTHRLKAALAAALHASGALAAMLRVRLRRKAVVLTYHRVLPDNEIATTPSHPGIVVSRSTFNMHARMLATYLRPVSLGEFMDGLRGDRPLLPRTCLVTFDDGWRDNLDHALPALETHRVPAVIFLVSKLIGTDARFWQERLTLLLRALGFAARSDAALRARALGHPTLSPLRDALSDGREFGRYEIASAVSALKGQELEEIEALISTLRSWPGLELPTGTADFLDWHQVRAMAARGVDFGAHGATHRILTHPRTDVAWEIAESRRCLERELGTAPRAFCYPNGDLNAAVMTTLREAGFQMAFSTRAGYVSEGDNPYEVRRMNMHEGMTCTAPLFLARLAGLW